MMTDRSDVLQTRDLLVRDFAWERSFFESVATAEDLHLLLKKALQPLLDRDMGRLLLILYRLDISEEKVKRLLAEAPPESLAADLATLIIAREWQKVQTRKKYSQGNL
jgi:hypothetical protein